MFAEAVAGTEKYLSVDMVFILVKKKGAFKYTDLKLGCATHLFFLNNYIILKNKTVIGKRPFHIE